jgi:hypothetical protein
MQPLSMLRIYVCKQVTLLHLAMAGFIYAHEHAWFAHESATDDATCGLVTQFSQAWLFVLTC